MGPTANLRERVEAFDYWHYQFDLGDGVVTPIVRPDDVHRHRERKRYFFDPAVKLLGGLDGKRVLDLGCNAGFWSLAAIEAGADLVVGVDGRQFLIDQANLVFEAKGVDPKRYRFEVANVFDPAFDPGESFDLVLCLGLLYHVNRPVELMRRIADWNTDLAVIDTDICGLPGAAFKVRHETIEHPRHSVDYELILWPSRQAVVELAGAFGYQTVTLAPHFSDWTGSRDYRLGSRRAFIASKRTAVDRIPGESRRTGAELVDAVRRRLRR
jgi:SAM-dependent methyltransferase